MQNSGSLSRAARWYIAGVVAAGLAVIIASADEMYRQPPSHEWLILAALTLLTGSFTVKIPRLSARLSVSDAFVFASVLLFGASVATVVVAFDSVIATLWLRRKSRSTVRSLFNLSAVALATWVAAQSFYAVVGARPGTALVLPGVLWPLLLLAGTYFLINTWLVAIALSFERGVTAIRLWIENFAWLSLNYLGGVSVAALVVSYTRSIDLTAVSVILPLLVISYLTYRTSMARVDEAQRHVDQVQGFYMSAIETLAMAVDAKDHITHGHIRRVQVYAVELSKRLGVNDDRQIKAIEAAALLHDMGKLGIPEHILNKPGQLTAAEFERMKQHAALGADLLSSIKFPYPVVPIVRHHHENWDGGGYPTGIAGTDIPLGARILSVVDCFDALTSDRPYRPRLSTADAFNILRERRGSMYDPLIVDTFIRTYHAIAPLAIKAGLEARSVFAADTADGVTTVDEPFDQIRVNASETALLMQCRQEMSKVESVRALVELAAQYLRRTTPATVFALYMYNQQSDSLTCETTSGDRDSLLKGLTIPVGQRISGWAAANHRIAVNSDAVLDLAQIAQLFRPPLRCTISSPLTAQGALLAVLTGYSPKENAFNDAHRYAFEEATSAFADRVAAVDARNPSNVVAFPIHKS
jgi:putative nucleotidyltransferase with HDIG domain